MEFFRFQFVSITVCPGHQQEASASLLSLSLLPLVFIQIDQIPQIFPFFRLNNSHGPGHCLGAG